VSRRTIFRWRSLGLEHRDPCPLDDPPAFLAWWARRMDNRPPATVRDWANRSPSVPASTVLAASKNSSAGQGAAAGHPAGAGAERSTRVAIDMATLSGHGLEAAVQTLRQNVEALSQLLAQALKDPDDSQLAHYQKRFEDAFDQLRKAEGSLLTLRKARGELAPRSEFRADLHNLLTGLRGMMRRRADNVTAALAKVPGFTAEQLGLVRAAVSAEGALDEQLLRSSRFWRVGPDGSVQFPAQPAA
jgi:hypothetical protein